MFGIGLLIAFTSLVAYVAWRASTARGLAGRVATRSMVGGAVAAWLLFFVGRFVAHDASGWLWAAVELVALDSLVVLFLAAVCLLAVELLTGFGWLLPKLAPTLRAGALVLALALSAVALVQAYRAPVVREHEVVLPGLPRGRDGMVMVALSDLHVGRRLDRDWLAARVDQVRALEPDVVVLLGDVFEGRSEASDELLAPLAQLSPPLGVWAVLGNHDSHRARGERSDGAAGGGDGTGAAADGESAGRSASEPLTAGAADGELAGRSASEPLTAGAAADSSEALFARVGVRVLRNGWALLAPGLVLAGVDDLTAARRSGAAEGAIERALAGRPEGAAVLLSHTPWQVEQAADAGAGLMLSGHTHGGQIWPFGELVRLRYPWLAGRYVIGSMTLIVCRGTGTWGPRMRLWQPSEMLRITLRAP